jgi:uncharacterized DUF497 family protein
MPDIEIRHLLRDDWNREHATKHGFSIAEIDALLTDRVCGRETYKGRYQVLKSNQQRRSLSFVIGSVPNLHDSWYVFSARPASRREHRRYGSHIEGNEP